MGYLQAGQYESLAQAATSAMQSSEAYAPFQRIMQSGRRRAGGEGGENPLGDWMNMLNSRTPLKPFQDMFKGVGMRATKQTQQQQAAQGMWGGEAFPKIAAAARNTQNTLMSGGFGQFGSGVTTMPRQTTVASVVSPGQTQVIRPSQQPQQARRQAPSASTDGSLLTGQDAMGMGSFGVSTLLGG